MNQPQLDELKVIADNLAVLGPNPKSDDRRKATARLALMARFERLIRAASPADRHEIATVLRSMLAEAVR